MMKVCHLTQSDRVHLAAAECRQHVEPENALVGGDACRFLLRPGVLFEIALSQLGERQCPPLRQLDIGRVLAAPNGGYVLARPLPGLVHGQLAVRPECDAALSALAVPVLDDVDPPAAGAHPKAKARDFGVPEVELPRWRGSDALHEPFRQLHPFCHVRPPGDQLGSTCSGFAWYHGVVRNARNTWLTSEAG